MGENAVIFNTNSQRRHRPPEQEEQDPVTRVKKNPLQEKTIQRLGNSENPHELRNCPLFPLKTPYNNTNSVMP